MTPASGGHGEVNPNEPFILVTRGAVAAFDAHGAQIRTGRLSLADMQSRLPGAQIIEIGDEKPQAHWAALANERARVAGQRL